MNEHKNIITIEDEIKEFSDKPVKSSVLYKKVKELESNAVPDASEASVGDVLTKGEDGIGWSAPSGGGGITVLDCTEPYIVTIDGHEFDSSDDEVYFWTNGYRTSGACYVTDYDIDMTSGIYVLKFQEDGIDTFDLMTSSAIITTEDNPYASNGSNESKKGETKGGGGGGATEGFYLIGGAKIVLGDHSFINPGDIRYGTIGDNGGGGGDIVDS